MTTTVTELYAALRAAGVSDDLAQRAAAAVIGVEDKTQLATKADLFALESRLMRFTVGVLATMTAIFGAMAAALRFIK